MRFAATMLLGLAVGVFAQASASLMGIPSPSIPQLFVIGAVDLFVALILYYLSSP